MEKTVNHSDIFTDIYKNNGWNGGESVSGSGSSIENTKRLRKALPELIKNLKIESILDIPCGDFHWMKELRIPDIHYIGADIVPELIESNEKKYGQLNRYFQVLDVINDKLPQVDLVICRDCLVHLSYEDAMNAMANICASNSKYVLTTTFTLHDNDDIQTGDWRPLNLGKPPFSLPPPIALINEGYDHPYFCDKAMGIWRIQN